MSEISNDRDRLEAKGVTDASLPYAPPPYSYLFWRIRENGGAVYWDTSSDGTTWTNQAFVADAALFSLEACTVELYAETYGSSLNPGVAQFSVLNQ